MHSIAQSLHYARRPTFQKFHLSTRCRLNAVIGIDLGTTYSAVAILGPDGPQVISDEMGVSNIPSVVAVTENDELIVGKAAVDAKAGPANTFYSFKRLIGRKAKEVAGLAAEQLAYSVCEGDRGECVVYSPGSDDLITPEELSAWMLQYLKRQAEAKLRESVTGAVITVPAHFDGRQRGATLFAAENAGLSTVHLLQEPVAAAMAYGINGGTDGETVLVFDLGGGTFDVSVLQAFEGIMEVLGTAGDARLGGDDFDAALAEWIVGRVECEREWALGAARRAKEELSTRDVAVIDAPSGERVELTQETFEAVTLGLFQRMADVLDSIGRDLFVEWAMPPLEAVPGAFGQGEPQPRAASHPERSCTAQPAVQDRWAPPQRRISRVALVGQMTRLPSLRAFVARVTGVAPCMSVDPGEAVALGAATHAGVLVGSVGSVELMDGSFVGELHNRVTGFGEWLP